MGLGQTFEIFLMGKDGRLRTDSGNRKTVRALSLVPFEKDGPSDLLLKREDSHPMGRYTNSDGIPMVWLSIPVEVSDTDYLLVTEMEESEAFSIKNRIWMALLLLSSILSVAMTGAALAVSSKISQPFSAMSDWAEKVATGDLAIRDIPESEDEIGRLVRNFKMVVEFLKDTATLAMDVASGDYSTDIEPRSPHDELGASLKKMTESLKDASCAMEAFAAGDFHVQVKVKGPNDLFSRALNSMVEKIRITQEHGRIQARQKSLQAELNEIMRGDKSVNELSRDILSFFCICFKSVLGSFYIRDDESETWKLYSGFALTSHRTMPLTVTPGAGLAGQAISQKKRVLLRDCPEEFMNTQSVVAGFRLASVLVFPFVREGRVEGLMEMGMTGRFAERDLEFLDMVSESVAIAIFSAVSRFRMKELLDKTVNQARDLTSKQQELNLINEDLKEQTEKLRQSEKQLLAKEEELRNINTALEERTLVLEQQKDAVREKNIELEITQAELIEKSARLEEISRHKSEFLANMSHELRTPLNSILLISRLLEENRQGNLNPRQIEFAQTVHAAGLDLLNLINDILDLSRIEAGKMELTPVPASVSDLERRLRANFSDICREKGIDLITGIEPDMTEDIHIDLKRIDQVLKNLVSNAVKFTERGHVNVSFSMYREPVPGIESEEPFSPALRIIVADTGVGVPENMKEAIFEAFRQADENIHKKFGGTGLGLSISREIVRLMGGDIFVDSREGLGSTFTVYLPGVFGKRKDAQAEKGGIIDMAPPEGMVFEEQSAVTGELTGRKILIVDEDMRTVYALIHCFERESPTVIVGKSGEECLDILGREGDVDLLIMDVLMPGMDGFAAMKAIRSDPRFKFLPVIALTARAMKGDREKCIEAGVSEYISKPVDMNRLMEMMKDLLSRTPENEINV
jgi:signal transduction histidine kinase/CheY-like chemotaxis protein/HAMP domain-containing protein